MQRRFFGLVGSLLLVSSAAAAQGAQPAPSTAPAEPSAEEGGLSPEAQTQAAVAAETTPPPANEHDGDGSIKDRSQHKRPYGLSGMAYMPWYFGIGIGVVARFEIPIVHDGFISSINDQISLEPSFAIAFRSQSDLVDRAHFLDFTPALYATWSFTSRPSSAPTQASVSAGVPACGSIKTTSRARAA